MQERWRIRSSGDSVPPVRSFLWAEHAVTTRLNDDTAVFGFDGVPYLTVPMAVAIALRNVCRQWGKLE